MKYYESDKVDTLIKSVIYAGYNESGEIIEDLTFNQACNLLNKYKGNIRVMTVFPKQVINENAIFFLENVDSVVYYLDISALYDIEVVNIAMRYDKNTISKLTREYNNIPKNKEYLMFVIVNAIRLRDYEKIQSFINNVVEQGDLPVYEKALIALNEKISNYKNIVPNKNNVNLRKMCENNILKFVAKMEEHLIQKQIEKQSSIGADIT